MEKIIKNIDNYLLDDAPIKTFGEDKLGRKKFAEELGKSILNIKADNGFVYALEGEWGSGKTSIMNMATDYLKKNHSEKEPIIIIRFNPWWFSGQNQLIKQFFNEFTSELQKADIFLTEDISKLLNCFSKIVAPLQYIPIYGIAAKIVSNGASSVAGGLSEIAQEKEENVQSIKNKIDKAINKQDARFLIVIDDIDRLASEEIRQLFRVIKAIANFPKTIYLLAYDEKIVIDALEKVQENNGKKYLEKIVQVSVDVPLINKIKLRKIFHKMLEQILEETQDRLFDNKLWRNIYNKGIEHFLCSIRDVNRLINRLQAVYPPVKNEVNAVDFITLQALKVFQPNVYEFIKENKDMFTGAEDALFKNDHIDQSKKRKTAEKFLDEIPGKHREYIKTMLLSLSSKWSMLFNGATYDESWLSEWRKKGRLQSPDKFECYFRFGISDEDLSSAKLEEIILEERNNESFKKIFNELAKEKLYDGTSKLEIFLDRIQDYTKSQIPIENIKPIISVIFDIGDQYLFNKDSISYLSTNNEYRFGQIISQLLSQIEEQEERYKILEEAIKTGGSIYLPANYTVSLGQEHSKYTKRPPELPEEKREVSLIQQERLEKICLEKIKEAAKVNKLLSIFHFDHLLIYWESFEGTTKELKKYIERILDDDKNIIEYIGHYAMVNRQLAYDSSQSTKLEEASFTINLIFLNKYLPIELEELFNRVKKISKENYSWVTTLQKKVIETFIKEVPIFLTQSTEKENE